MTAMGVLVVLPPLRFAQFTERFLVPGRALGAVKGG
jgi:ABC-type glycerol-3-phosphate transport system permease component